MSTAYETPFLSLSLKILESSKGFRDRGNKWRTKLAGGLKRKKKKPPLLSILAALSLGISQGRKHRCTFDPFTVKVDGV